MINHTKVIYLFQKTEVRHNPRNTSLSEDLKLLFELMLHQILFYATLITQLMRINYLTDAALNGKFNKYKSIIKRGQLSSQSGCFKKDNLRFFYTLIYFIITVEDLV